MSEYLGLNHAHVQVLKIYGEGSPSKLLVISSHRVFVNFCSFHTNIEFALFTESGQKLDKRDKLNATKYSLEDGVSMLV